MAFEKSKWIVSIQLFAPIKRDVFKVQLSQTELEVSIQLFAPIKRDLNR